MINPDDHIAALPKIDEPFLHVVDPLDPKAAPQPVDNEAWRLAMDTDDALRGIDNRDIRHRILASRFQDALHTGERRVITRVLFAIDPFGPDRRKRGR